MIKPWVGNKYGRDGVFRKRIMIICGWLCCDEELTERDDKIFTTNIFKAYFHSLKKNQTRYYIRTFRRLEELLVGRTMDVRERKEVWNSLLYYPYCPVLIKMSGRPTKKDLNGAEDLFFQALKDYQPEGLIVIGTYTFSLLPDSYYVNTGTLKVEHGELIFGRYEIDDILSVPLLQIPHPRTLFFPREETKEMVNIFINGIRKYDYEKLISESKTSPYDYIIEVIRNDECIQDKDKTIEKFGTIYDWLKNKCCDDIFYFDENKGAFKKRTNNVIIGYVVIAITMNIEEVEEKAYSELFLNSKGMKTNVKFYKFRANKYINGDDKKNGKNKLKSSLINKINRINKELEELKLKHPDIPTFDL